MGCKDCKKKKLDDSKLKTSTKRIINPDKVVTWIVVVWFFLGLYGLWSIIETIFHL